MAEEKNQGGPARIPEYTTDARIDAALGIFLDAADETCIVSHPDAGGPCGNGAASTVYGLPLCSRHFGEACREAHTELSVAADGVRIGLEHATLQNHTIDRALELAINSLQFPATHADCETLLIRTYPLKDELVDQRTKESTPGNGVAHAEDYWMERRLLIHRLMRIAYDARHEDLVRLLEPLREQAAAQLGYALALK